MLVWTFLVVFPFLWMLMTAFKSDQEILFSPWRFPHHLYWDNFRAGLEHRAHRPLFSQHVDCAQRLADRNAC